MTFIPEDDRSFLTRLVGPKRAEEIAKRQRDSLVVYPHNIARGAKRKPPHETIQPNVVKK